MAKRDQETFGDRFCRLVDEAGLSARDVCQIVGWKSDSSYYKARRGDLGSVNPNGLLRLAARLGVSPYYLMGEPEPRIRQPEDVAETVPPPDPTLVQISRDLKALAAAAKKDRAEVRALRERIEAMETKEPRARRRAS